jgi:hypothetical protein
LKLALCALIALASCTKNILTEKPLTVEEFKSMLQVTNTYQITEYTDTLGNAIDYPVTDKDNRYIFAAADSARNGRVYNTTTQTLCFGHWVAYEHATLGYIVFEWMDFDLTPTYYRVINYNVEQGWFVIKSGNTILKYSLTR